MMAKNTKISNVFFSRKDIIKFARKYLSDGNSKLRLLANFVLHLDNKINEESYLLEITNEIEKKQMYQECLKCGWSSEGMPDSNNLRFSCEKCGSFVLKDFNL
jgi:ribosomal protein S27AE